MDPRSVPAGLTLGHATSHQNYEPLEDKVSRLEREVEELKKELSLLRASQEAGWGSYGR